MAVPTAEAGPVGAGRELMRLLEKDDLITAADPEVVAGPAISVGGFNTKGRQPDAAEVRGLRHGVWGKADAPSIV